MRKTNANHAHNNRARSSKINFENIERKLGAMVKGEIYNFLKPTTHFSISPQLGQCHQFITRNKDFLHLVNLCLCSLSSSVVICKARFDGYIDSPVHKITITWIQDE